MDQYTLLTVGLVVVAGAALFVTTRAGVSAVGVLSPAPSVDDDGEAAGSDDAASTEPDGSLSTARDDGSLSAAPDDDGWSGSRITAAEHERMRRHLEKDRYHRSPDDLLPPEDDES